MITLEKIKFYKEHYWNYQDTMNGYPNQLKGIEGILSNEDLSYFLRLISDMFYVKKDLASTEWIDRLNENLKKSCDNEETIKEMWKLRDYIEEIEKIEKKKTE